ncbi:putative RecA/RadA family phage recombinase [Bradyrhizobium sp. USDA 4011]
MQNQVQKGDAINVVAPAGGVVSGNGYLFGSMFGVAGVTAAAGVSFALWLVGEYTLAKNSAEAWTVGELIYWDNTAFHCTSSSNTGANKLIGVATAVAANPSSTGDVRLNGVFIS